MRALAVIKLLVTPLATIAFVAALTPDCAVLLLGLHGLPKLAADPFWQSAASHTLELAGVTCVLALPLGSLAAAGIWGAHPFFRWTVLATGLLTLLIPQAWIGSGLASLAGVHASLGTLIVAHATRASCLVLLVMSAAFDAQDPLMQQAAAAQGATPGYAWRSALLPDLWRPALVATMAAASLSLGQSTLDQLLEPASFVTLDVLTALAGGMGGGAVAPATLMLASIAAGGAVVAALGRKKALLF